MGVVLGFNYDGNYRQDKGGSLVLSTTGFTLGSWYYLKVAERLCPHAGIVIARWCGGNRTRYEFV